MCILLNVKKHEKTFALNVDIFIYIKISVNYLTQEGSNMPDISMLVEIAEFYEVDIREIIDGERKSENMNDEVKVTILAVADYADKQKNKRY